MYRYILNKFYIIYYIHLYYDLLILVYVGFIWVYV